MKRVQLKLYCLVYDNQFWINELYYFHLFRFGIVVAMKTTKKVKKGEEFLVNYGYGYKHAPVWYKELFKISVKKNPELKKTYKHIINGVDLDAEIKNVEIPVALAMNNRLNEEEDEKDVKIPTPDEKPKVQNLLGTTYWY